MADAESLQADICVIGAGAGGLTVAAGGAQMGASVILLERHHMGGDCLNTGCIPSKSLLAAAHAAHRVRVAGRLGIATSPPQVDMAKVHQHVHQVIAQIAPHDSQERFEQMGVKVIRQEGRFVSPHEVQAGQYSIKARRFVIATGSSPNLPPLPGLASIPFFTNETIFDLQTLPEHLLVLGGGPIGLELAQAFLRLGSRVTLLARSGLLKRDDPQLVEELATLLQAEGMTLLKEVQFQQASQTGQHITLEITHQGEHRTITGSHLLVATGREANVSSLNLEAANIHYSRQGIQVDGRLRTTNPHIFALGDVAGPHLFTHMAGYQAGIVLQNILFRLPVKTNYQAVPWVTFTDPELAQVGMTEATAHANGLPFTILQKPFLENDRARAEGVAYGRIKLVAGPKGRLLGASALGPLAGEIIQPWIVAITHKLSIRQMSQWISPYPTFSEINKGVAGSYFTPTLYGTRTKKLVKLLAKLG
ncbi:MAG: FAD-dependent oxidoreductase [Magnetococcales bacterium]|nr:FAD-dependent oxidoreductase [Magnetococcales bacterium]NGZ25666.1 FAD-dependent oxidoreductase [Magnetococcales bacterium]